MFLVCSLVFGVGIVRISLKFDNFGFLVSVGFLEFWLFAVCLCFCF